MYTFKDPRISHLTDMYLHMLLVDVSLGLMLMLNNLVMGLICVYNSK